ncbi:MAG TPA: hypothetical protein VL422_00950 [Miltoncostaea sp.]|nr:hypothetical protein [Miltoncostaea sp.]
MRRRAALAAAVPMILAAAATAAGAGSSTGTLTLREGEGEGARSLAYRWTDAPLQTGPAASRAVGLPFPIRNSDTRYLQATLESFAGAVPLPASCAGFTSRPVEVLTSIGDPRAILQIEGVTLDLRRGRGSALVSLARTGADAFREGEFPAPGLLRVETRGCVTTDTGEPVPGDDGGPYLDVRDLRAAAVNGERLLGRFASMSIDDREIPLRRRDGGWRGTLRVAEADAGRFGPATEAVASVTLRGTPVGLHASCTVPPELYPARRVRSRAQAVRLMLRAGFPRARVGRADPARRGVYGLRGITTSVLPCDLAVRVAVVVPPR